MDKLASIASTEIDSMQQSANAALASGDITNSILDMASNIDNITVLMAQMKKTNPLYDNLEDAVKRIESNELLDERYLTITYMIYSELAYLKDTNNYSLITLYYLILTWIESFYVKDNNNLIDIISGTSDSKCHELLTKYTEQKKREQEVEQIGKDDIAEVDENFARGGPFMFKSKVMDYILGQSTAEGQSSIGQCQLLQQAISTNTSAVTSYIKTQIINKLSTASTSQEDAIDVLTTMNTYINQQANEYSEVYERLQTLNATQQRKSTFHVKDLKTLNRWSFWCRVIFWVLVVFLVLMVLVDKYRAVAAFTATVDDKLKQMATTATQIAAAGQ